MIPLRCICRFAWNNFHTYSIHYEPFAHTTVIAVHNGYIGYESYTPVYQYLTILDSPEIIIISLTPNPAPFPQVISHPFTKG